MLNSIAHLIDSNRQLLDFTTISPTAGITTAGTTSADTTTTILRANGNSHAVTEKTTDPELSQAVLENKGVIERTRERVDLVRREVEGRGSRWTFGEVEAEIGRLERGEIGAEDEGGGEGRNGGADEVGGSEGGHTREGRGGLSDEELRRRMERRLMDEESDDGGNGMHL